MNDDELYKEAWRKWGPESQLIMLMEESAELIKAIAKYMRVRHQTAITPIVEEMADVNIMIEQFLLIFHQKPEFKMFKAKKLDRLTEKVYQK